MTPLHRMDILAERLRAADSMLACLDMRQMTSEVSAIVIGLKKVLEQGISKENCEEAQEILGTYRALKI